MDFDPVLLARLQFAFTIIFHIIFPSLHDWAVGLSRDPRRDVAAQRQ